MNEPEPAPEAAWWDGAWLDVVAFIAGLGMAWYWNWETKDLIWSLWLSSLAVGYTMILWGLLGRMIKTRKLISGMILLGFLSLHFGLFHIIHSALLNTFFPIAGDSGVPAIRSYGQVMSHYWYFLPAAFIAEREGFIQMWSNTTGHPINVIADAGNGFLKPYRNVMRMHLLIFFFIFANLAKLENILVYAVVYAVYFFPWRLLKNIPEPKPVKP